MIATVLKKLRSQFLKNSPNTKFLLTFALLGFAFLNSVSAQVATNYTFQELQLPTYADLNPATKTQLFTGAWNDEAPINIPIGYSFTYNGAVYTNLTVSPNGFVYFGTASAGIATVYNPISNANTYSGAIAVYGQNLSVGAVAGAPQTNSVSYTLDTSGGIGNYILKIEWAYFRRIATDSTPMRAQLWLNQNGNVIDVLYGTMGAPVTAVSGQVGLRGAVNTDFNNRAWPTNVAWPILPATMNAGATNGATVLTRNAAYPVAASNRLFRWSPIGCLTPSLPTTPITAITNNSATISWNPTVPAPGVGYQYEIRTSGAAGSGATGLVAAASGTTTATSLNLTGLVGNTTYYLYVRSDCGSSSFSTWTTVVSFTTLCDATNPNYLMYFDEFDALYGYAVPALPGCTSQQNVGLGPLNVWKTSQPTTPSMTGGFYDEHLVYDATTGTGGTHDANTWFFTKGINLVAGNTYKIGYMYGGSTETAAITNKMLVQYGNYPSAAAMAAGVTLADHNNIKASPIQNYINFTASTTGVFYFGFKAYSAAANGRLFLDNIEITEPACVRPTALSVNSITGTSALVNWVAPTPAPASGYAYYLITSTDAAATALVAGTVYQIITVGTTDFTLYGAASNAVGTIFTATGAGLGTGVANVVPSAPSYTQAPTGYTSPGTTLVSLSGLTGSTTYYIWVRGYCYFGDFSEWTAMQTFTTLFQPAYCIPVSTQAISYFSNFTTTGGIANINNSSGYSPNGYGSYVSQIVSQSESNAVNFSFGLAGPTVGVAIWVDWNNDGTFAATERMFNTGAYVSTASGSFTVPALQPVGDYTMRILMDYWATSPSPCTFSVTGPRGEAEDYTFRVLTPPPALNINMSSSTQCASTNSPLITITSPLVNYNTYTWSPAIGVSGTSAGGYTFNSNTTITYTLTANQTVAPFSTRTVTYTYNANPLPTPITITPASPATVCIGGAPLALNATGGIVSGVPIYTEDFNTGAPGWVAVNNSTLGNVAAAAWTIRPSGYNPAGSSGITSVVSNDSSQFYISNSDSQGSGSNTNVVLTSPVFSLVGYTNASLSFFHYYKPWINGSAKVELFSGGSWITLQTWGASGTTPAQGAPTNFANVIYNLNTYVGQSGLQVRFTYQASWGFVWAIDNFQVTGSANSAINWNTQSAPVANGVAVPGLYTSAVAIPANQYLAGTGTNVVYALPTVATVYTASASTPPPVCNATTAITVNVSSINGGTASSDQTICSGAPADLTVTGFSATGSVVKWQYASDLAFTTPVDIPSSASATLTTAQMAAIGISADIYFRAVITNSGCNGYSTVVKITFTKTTWNGSAWSNGAPSSTVAAVFAGNYTSTGDLNACSVTVLSGAVSFLTGHSLIVQNAVAVSGGTLTFANGASLVQPNNVANAVGVSSGGNTGNATFARNTTGMLLFDYTYWSSPVYPQTLLNLSPLTLSDKYFKYDPVVNNWVNVPSISLMDPAKGYIVRAPQTFNTSTPTIFNASFVGTPNNGTITTPIVVSTGNVNLIGNPYPSAVNADLFLSDPLNTPYIGGTIYLWTHNTPIAANNYSSNDYALYNYSGGIGTGTGALGTNNSVPTGKIASGQAFFAIGSVAGTNNATFKNSMRVVGSNSQFYKNNSSSSQNAISVLERNRVWLELTNTQGHYKQTMVGYIENATNELDRGFDGETFNGGNPIDLYSTLGSIQLGIQGRVLPFDENDIVPLGYKASAASSFEIKLSDFDGFFSNQVVYLEDKLLNVIHDLKQSPYSFVSDAGVFNDRFQLRYTNPMLQVNVPTFDENTVVVYKENQSIHIATTLTAMNQIQVFDIRGRELFVKKDLNTTDFVISNLQSAQQVLLLTIVSIDGAVVHKKIQF